MHAFERVEDINPDMPELIDARIREFLSQLARVADECDQRRAGLLECGGCRCGTIRIDAV